MIILGVLVLAGVVLGLAVGSLAADLFTHPALQRRNFRGKNVATAGGIVFPLALLPLWAATYFHQAQQWSVVDQRVLYAVGMALIPVLAFAFLGLVDDVLAYGDDRGFRGHLRALMSGRLTTGGIKLLGGGLTAVGLASFYSRPATPWWEIGVDAGVIALAANLANLFDRAPGRVTKFSALALVLLLITTTDSERSALGATALVVGLAVGLLVPELRERIMLGDTGANPLGAMLGLGVVFTTGRITTLVILVILLALNLASEKISFSRVISRTPVLRWFDGLGRPAE